jgi:biopolymer transport protein ExbD
MAVKIDKGQAAGLINLTPMIDVVFQLLLFFLVASKFAAEERQIKVALPPASEAKPITAKLNEYFVNVDRDGRYFANGKIVNRAQLEQILMQLSRNNPGRQKVAIRADKRCQFEHVVAVINLCNKANIRDYHVNTAEPGNKG